MNTLTVPGTNLRFRVVGPIASEALKAGQTISAAHPEDLDNGILGIGSIAVVQQAFNCGWWHVLYCMVSRVPIYINVGNLCTAPDLLLLERLPS